MSADQYDAERFRDIVMGRIEHLGLTSDQIARSGGPSTTTMSKIRKADPTPPRGDTYGKLDEALRWKKGSARRVARFGGDPIELPAGLELEEALAEVESAGLSERTRQMILEAWGVKPNEQRGTA